MRAKDPQHRAGHHHRVLFLDSAHAHAQMLRAQHHSNTERVELVHEHVRNLRREAFLDLQPP